MTVRQVERIIPDLEDHKVSVVARSPRGFIPAYMRHRTPARMESAMVPGESITWARKRDLFIRRTLAAYTKNPTYRRALALMAWAYMPRNLSDSTDEDRFSFTLLGHSGFLVFYTR